MDLPDLASVRIQEGDVLLAAQPKRRRLPRHIVGEWFLRGPIPGVWLEAAARLPGKSLHVALIIWHEAQLKKSDTAVLSGAAVSKFGIGRHALRLALTKLENAQLIAVERRPGCAVRAIVRKL